MTSSSFLRFGLRRICCSNVVKPPIPNRRTLRAEGVDAAARGFLAGMTDRYAVALYEHLYIPKPWVSLAGRWS